MGKRVEMERERMGHTLVVRVRGELDLHSAEIFRRDLDAWFLQGDATRLILNLSRVTFLDSTGLGAVLGRLRRAQEAGRTMSLVPPAGVARMMIDVGALGRVLPLFRSERLALAEEAAMHG